MKTSELQQMSDEELRQQVRDQSESLFRLRLRIVTGSVENVRAVRNSRREIARIKTILRQRELAASKGVR